MTIYGSNNYKNWLSSYSKKPYSYDNVNFNKYGYDMEELYVKINNTWITYALVFYNRYNGQLDLIGFSNNTDNSNHIISFNELYTIYSEYSYELDDIENILLELDIEVYPRYDYSINFLVIYLILFIEQKNIIIDYFFKYKDILPKISIPCLTYTLLSIKNKLNYEEKSWRNLFVNHQLHSMNKHSIAKFLHIYDWTYIKSEHNNYIIYLSEPYKCINIYNFQLVHIFQLLYCLKAIHSKLSISNLNFTIISINDIESDEVDVYITDETGEYNTYIFPCQKKYYSIKIIDYEDNLDHIHKDYQKLSSILNKELDGTSIETLFIDYKFKNNNIKIKSLYNITNIIPITPNTSLPTDFTIKYLII